MLERPLPDLTAWVNYLGQADIPVLKRTARELARLRENEENVNGRQVSAVIMQDPLMALRVLAHIETHRQNSQNADITTIDRAVMMIGITPFFRKFEALPVVEDTLKGHPQALIGLLRVIARARQAAIFARDWAVLRHDLDTDEVTVAALLHDTAEILLWSLAPGLMMRIRTLQEQERTLRSAEAQLAVLGTTAQDLQLALARDWRLPRLLQILMDNAQAENPRVRNVACAVDLARHSANGWNDPALADDLASIGKLLGLGQEALIERIGRFAASPPPAQSKAPSEG